MEDWRHGGFGLYIHWPFCQSKCPYCDFNSHVAAHIDQTAWQAAYLTEIDRAGAQTPGRVLNSVFFGGGTPSLMEPSVVGAILDRVAATWTLANDIEITLEANPGSIEAGRFQGYRMAGVNRVSMGFQALNDPDLKALGRLHSVEEGRVAFDIARRAFDRVSFDLIYARQHQTLQAWRDELGEALTFAADHLSLYQLTIEDGTAFGDRFAKGGLKGLPGEDLAADFYDLTQELCGAAGYGAYEVSNHARPGAESRHNLIYWRGGDYAGIGPGAHGRVTQGGIRWATEAVKAPGDWLARVKQGKGLQEVRVAMTETDRADEYLIMGLRLREGISLMRWRDLGGRGSLQKTAELQAMGMVTLHGDVLAATVQGRLVLNQVIRALASA